MQMRAQPKVYSVVWYRPLLICRTYFSTSQINFLLGRLTPFLNSALKECKEVSGSKSKKLIVSLERFPGQLGSVVFSAGPSFVVVVQIRHERQHFFEPGFDIINNIMRFHRNFQILSASHRHFRDSLKRHKKEGRTFAALRFRCNYSLDLLKGSKNCF